VGVRFSLHMIGAVNSLHIFPFDTWPEDDRTNGRNMQPTDDRLQLYPE